MRYLIFILSLLPFFCKAQNSGVVIKNGATNQANIQKGATGADSVTLLGVMDTTRAKSYLSTGANSLRLIGRVVLNSSDSTLYLYNGLGWVKVGTGGTTTDTAGLSDRINYNLTRINNLSDSVKANRDSINIHRTAIDGKEPTITPGTTADYWQGDKTWQPKSGLPISTATQAALDNLSDSAAAAADSINNLRVAVDGKISNTSVPGTSESKSINITGDVQAGRYRATGIGGVSYYMTNATAIRGLGVAGGTIYFDASQDATTGAQFFRADSFVFNGKLVVNNNFQVGTDGKIKEYGNAKPANGQVLIGDGTDMELATITAGDNITVTNGPGSISIAATAVDSSRYVLYGDSNTVYITPTQLNERVLIYDVDSFGAIPNDDLDDSGPIQDAIIAWYNGGKKGKVVGWGIYDLKNTPTLNIPYPWDSVNTYIQQGQLYLPLSRETDTSKGVLEFCPRYSGSITFNGDGTYPKSTFVIRSTEGTYSPGQYIFQTSGSIVYNANTLYIHDVVFLLKNRGTDPVRMGCVNNTRGNLIAERCFFGVDTVYTALIEPTTPNNFGIRGSTNRDTIGWGINRISDCFSYGLYSGYTISANTYATGNTSAYCLIGITGSNNSGSASLQIPMHYNKSCKYDLSGIGHPGIDSCIMNIGVLNCDVDTNSAAWYKNTYTIWDNGNALTGDVRYNIIMKLKRRNDLFAKLGGSWVRAYPFGDPSFMDSVTKSNDSFFYYKGAARTFIGLDNSGSGSGIDSIRISNDSLYQCAGGTCTYVGMVNSGGGGGSTAWGDITGTLSDQTDLQSALDGKQDTLGFTAENVANKATDFSTVNNTLYPTVEAVDDYVASELSGYLPSATAASTYVSLSGSYSNPTWITALAWSKITSTPTTLSGYGITDAVPNTRTVNGQALSANVTLDIDDVAPTQTGNATKILTTDGTNATWQAPAVGVSVNTQSGTTYTILSSDNGKIIEFTNSSAVAVTLPSGLGTTFTCIIRQNGTGDVTLGTSGTTVHNANSHTSTRAQYSSFAILPTGTANTFITQGDMD